jgi:hypothetical protein
MEIVEVPSPPEEPGKAARYQLKPDWERTYRPINKDTSFGHRIANVGSMALRSDTRAVEIDQNMVISEPRQDGVLRYPPVRVCMPLYQEKLDNYLNIGWRTITPPEPEEEGL